MNTANYSIKELKRPDIKELAELATETYIEAFSHLYSVQEMTEQIEDYRSARYFESVFGKDIILIASAGSKIIGYVQFGIVKSDFPDAKPTDRELERLYVKSSYQGKGVGKSLLETALAHPIMERAPNIYLDVWSENIRAQELYKKYSFEVVGVLPWYRHGRFVSNDLIMVRKNH